MARYELSVRLKCFLRQTKLVYPNTLYDGWLIGYKNENRWVLAYRIRRRAVTYGTTCFRYFTIKRCIEQSIEPQEQTRGNDIMLIPFGKRRKISGYNQ